MIFCFVDESYGKTNSTYYVVLVGLLVPGKYLYEITVALEELKSKIGIQNFKELKDTKRFKRAEKIQFTKEIKNILQSYDTILISIIVLKEPAYQVNDEMRKNLYFLSLKLISERVTLYSWRHDKIWILVSDNLNCKEMTAEVKNIIKNDIRGVGQAFSFKIGEYLFETPFFVDDDYSNLVQIADLVATALNYGVREFIKKEGRIEIDVENLYKYSPYLELYWDLFDRSHTGKIEGWGIKKWVI